jgi:hypothetical protein
VWGQFVRKADAVVDVEPLLESEDVTTPSTPVESVMYLKPYIDSSRSSQVIKITQTVSSINSSEDQFKL